MTVTTSQREVSASVLRALYENLIGGYEVFESPQGIVLIGPRRDEGEPRDIWLLTISPAEFTVSGASKSGGQR